MVLHQGKCLHKKPATPYLIELEQIDNAHEVFMQEVARWQAILSVNYTNFLLVDNTPL